MIFIINFLSFFKFLQKNFFRMINKEIMIDGRNEINKTFNLILFGMPMLV